jgi:hypothetical protein
MGKLLVTFITFAVSAVWAQQQPQTPPAQPAPSSTAQAQSNDDGKNIWVEISLPFSKNGGFGDAQGDSKTTVNGFKGAEGFTVAWEPFVHNPSQSKVMAIFRHVGFTAGATINDNQPSGLYDLIVSQTVTVLSPLEVNTKCGGSLGIGGEQCATCGYDSAGLLRTCSVHTVFGRVTPLKYSPGSVAFGMYVPKSIGKLIVQAGVNARLHIVREGQISDDLTTTTETTTDAVIRVAYPVYQNISVSGGYEQSFWGTQSGPKNFKFHSYTVGVSMRW